MTCPFDSTEMEMWKWRHGAKLLLASIIFSHWKHYIYMIIVIWQCVNNIVKFPDGFKHRFLLEFYDHWKLKANHQFEMLLYAFLWMPFRVDVQIIVQNNNIYAATMGRVSAKCLLFVVGKQVHLQFAPCAIECDCSVQPQLLIKSNEKFIQNKLNWHWMRCNNISSRFNTPNWSDFICISLANSLGIIYPLHPIETICNINCWENCLCVYVFVRACDGGFVRILIKLYSFLFDIFD